MTYPHDPILRAWLDGKAIQYLPTGTDVWLDIEGCDTATKTPHLYTDGRAAYRVKPVMVRYRVALIGGTAPGRWTSTADSLLEARDIEDRNDFIRWLTDWIEVQV